MCLSLLSSTSDRTNSTRLRLVSTRLDIGSSRHDSISARIDSARHRSVPTCLDIDPGQLGSTSARLTRLEICPDRLVSTPTINLNRLVSDPLVLASGIEPTRLDIGHRAHSSRHRPSAWVNSARQPPGSTRRDIGPCRLVSTSARVDLSRHQPEQTRLNIGLADSARNLPRPTSLEIDHRLKSTWLKIRPDGLVSTSVRVDSTRHGLGLTGLDIRRKNSARHQPEPTRLDNGLGRLDSTLAWAELTGNPPGLTRLDIGRPTRLDLGPGKLGSTSARPTRPKIFPD